MQFKKFPFVDPVSRARNPVLSGYSTMYPGGGFLGDTAAPVAASPSQTTIIMRAQPNAPPGWPGFFGWLKSEHPDFYNYAVAALPQAITMTEGHRTGGATLGRLMGLGDDDGIDYDASIDPGSIPTVSIADAGVGTSGGIPQASPSTAAQIISTLTAAAPSILNTVNQQQIFQTQLSRAAAGLPPLNTSQYGLTGSGITGLSSTALLALLGGGALLLVLASKK